MFCVKTIMVIMSLFLLSGFRCTDAEASLCIQDYYQDSDNVWKKQPLYSMEAEVGFKALSVICDGNNKYTVKKEILGKLKERSCIISVVKQHQSDLRYGKVMLSDCGAEKKNEAILMFTGDLMCLRGQQYSSEITGGYDFTPSFEYVSPIFGEADLVCGNLETLISESSPLTKNQVTINGQPQCNGPVSYLDALKASGFDALVTANNHCCDWGKTGIIETKTELDRYKFANVGTDFEERQTEYELFDVNGIRIAILSYTHILNQRGKLTPYELSIMVHCYDRVRMSQAINDAREAGADYVVVYMHWGSENTEKLNWYQINDSRDVANAGADIIIGSHPHCLQKSEYIVTDDGRTVLCMYSMGNFVSSMDREINRDTIILRIELCRKYTENTVYTKNVSLIPCHVTYYKGHNNVIIPDIAYLNDNQDTGSLTSSYKRIIKIMPDIEVYQGHQLF